MLGKAGRGMGGLPQEKEVKDGEFFMFRCFGFSPGSEVCLQYKKKTWV